MLQAIQGLSSANFQKAHGFDQVRVGENKNTLLQPCWLCKCQKIKFYFQENQESSA